MDTFEKWILGANAMIGAASAWSAWSAHRSARVAEQASHGNTEALRVARDSADAARDAADSMGDAVHQFAAQVAVSERREDIDRQMLQLAEDRAAPNCSASVINLDPTGDRLERATILIQNHGTEPFLAHELRIEMENGHEIVEIDRYVAKESTAKIELTSGSFQSSIVGGLKGRGRATGKLDVRVGRDTWIPVRCSKSLKQPLANLLTGFFER